MENKLEYNYQDFLPIFSNLALIYKNLGQDETALEFYKRLLGIKEK